MNAKFKTMVLALAIIAGACGSDSKSNSNSVSQKENQKKHQQELNKAEFEITKAKAEDLAFTKLTEILSAGETLQASEILVNVKGVKAGYTLKQIKNLSNTGVARIEANQKAIALKKAGSFTATLVLEHNTKADATITNAQFEILPADTIVLRFQKLIKDFSAGGSFSTQEILANVQGAKTGYTLKTIRLNGNASEIVSVAGTKPNLSLNFKKSGIFTATLVLEHNTKADATIIKSAFVANLNIKDPLYKDQWHLKNNIYRDKVKLQGGEEVKVDVNVEPVWRQGILGAEIKVGIFDTAIDYQHPDLKDNLPPENIMDHYPDEPFCDPTNEVNKAGRRVGDEGHGTKVAGVIAARDNHIGIRGIAPRATLYSYAVIPPGWSARAKDDDWHHLDEMLKALQRPEAKEIAVYNGSLTDGTDSENNIQTNHTEKAVLKEFDEVTRSGFGGLGASLVFAAGNEHYRGATSANNDFLNHYAVITVNSITGYGAFIPTKGQQTFDLANFMGTNGGNLWLVAPAGTRFQYRVMTTTPRCGKKPISYEISFGATSSAAPMVTGVIALLRSAYLKLTWRDVKLILAESAKKIVTRPNKDFDWQTTGKMYSNPTKNQTYQRAMGFGLVDAAAALELAKTWKPLPPMKTKVFKKTQALDTRKDKTLHSSDLQVENSQIQFIESVVVDLEITRTLLDKKMALQYFTLSLVAPDGTVGWIYRELDTVDERVYIYPDITQLRFAVNAFLGNSTVNGTWKLQFQTNNDPDLLWKNEGQIQEIKNWKLTIRGH